MIPAPDDDRAERRIDLPPVYFQHIRKTGGTSINEMVRLFFRESLGADGRGRPEDPVPNVGPSGPVLVTDHAEILSIAPPDAFTFAIFRDPFARLLSERRQWMQAGAEDLAASPPEVADAVLGLQGATLAEILARLFDLPYMVSSLWNHQAVMLGAWPILRKTFPARAAGAYAYYRLPDHFASGPALRAWLHANEGDILRRALKAMRGLDYVGLTEDLEAGVYELFARIGLPEPGLVVHRNVRAAFPDEAEPDLRALATGFLALDQELYDAARERYAVQGRVARGAPLDYVGRDLPRTGSRTVSAREPPGGHGWYPAHLRQDGAWSRWTGPGLESLYAVSAPAGRYRLDLELFGAITGRTVYEIEVTVENRPLAPRFAQLPSGFHVITVEFDRVVAGRFDLRFRFPDVGHAYGLEVRELRFTAIPDQAVPPPAVSDQR